MTGMTLVRFIALVLAVAVALPAVPAARAREGVGIVAHATYAEVHETFADGSERAYVLYLPRECRLAGVSYFCPSPSSCMARELPLNVPTCGMNRRRSARH